MNWWDLYKIKKGAVEFDMKGALPLHIKSTNHIKFVRTQLMHK